MNGVQSLRVASGKVVVLAPATGLRREIIVGSTGAFNISGRPIGTYNVTVSRAGFETMQLHGLTLSVGQVRTFDARLEIGTLTTQVEVTGIAVEVNRTSAEVGGVIGSQQVRLHHSGRRTDHHSVV